MWISPPQGPDLGYLVSIGCLQRRCPADIALAVSAVPFVVLAPEPPAFGQGAVVILASTAILATLGTSWQAGAAQRARIVRRAAAVLTVTVTAAGLRYLVAGHVMAVPTMDLLAKLIGLQGEDVDEGLLHKVWLKIWLACAALLLLTPTLGQVWAVILLPVTGSWPVLASAVVWFATVAMLRAMAVAPPGELRLLQQHDAVIGQH